MWNRITLWRAEFLPWAEEATINPVRSDGEEKGDRKKFEELSRGYHLIEEELPKATQLAHKPWHRVSEDLLHAVMQCLMYRPNQRPTMQQLLDLRNREFF